MSRAGNGKAAMVFYVEDDKNIRDLVIYTLVQSGLEARGFDSGADFFDACEKEPPALALLDIMLPGEDGMDILRQLRRREATAKLPVIMVTAKGSEYDKVIGLDTGADDYIAKPFGMMELVARVKALLRRTDGAESPPEQKLISGQLAVDEARRSVSVDGAEITLTNKEFELLRFLMANSGIVFGRDKLLNTLWGYDYIGGTRTVDVHIQTLRTKLGVCGGKIVTLRGVGYKFEG